MELSIYKETFECKICRDNDGSPLEFYKSLIGKLPDKDILTIRELGLFLEAFEELRDVEKQRKFCDSLSDDNLEA
jgi:hypothetical protein